MASKTHVTPIAVKDIVEANAALFRLSEIDGLIKQTENEYTQAVTQLRREADEIITPLAMEDARRKKGLELFAKKNRSSLLRKDEKTVKLSGGSFGWRTTPLKVSFKKGGQSKVLAMLKSLNLLQYIRVKESVDKEALLKDRPEIAGVSYTRHEKFFVEPKVAVDDSDAGKQTVELASEK